MWYKLFLKKWWEELEIKIKGPFAENRGESGESGAVVSAPVSHGDDQWFKTAPWRRYQDVEMGSWFFLDLEKERCRGMMWTIPPTHRMLSDHGKYKGIMFLWGMIGICFLLLGIQHAIMVLRFDGDDKNHIIFLVFQIPIGIGPCAEPIYAEKTSSRKAIPLFNRTMRFPCFSLRGTPPLSSSLRPSTPRSAASVTVTTKYTNGYFARLFLCCFGAGSWIN